MPGTGRRQPGGKERFALANAMVRETIASNERREPKASGRMNQNKHAIFQLASSGGNAALSPPFALLHPTIPEKIMHAAQMLSTHPHLQGKTNEALIRCIEECYDCAQTCTACADACLGEDDVAMLIQCIRLCLDCADLCSATGAIASRQTGSNAVVFAAALEACATACQRCAEECQKHAHHHVHCRICAEACASCQKACEEVRGSLQ